MLTRRLMRLLVLAAIMVLAGCSAVPGASKGSISFRDIFENRRGNEMRIVRTVELDVDEDGEREWLVLYRYDPTMQVRSWENTPIQGIVYDAVPCDPPMIQEWRLPFPDNDYLGEGEDIQATLVDMLANNDPNGYEATQELVIRGDGPVNTLSIYRFHDYIKNPCVPPDTSKQGFTLLGFFRSNGPILVSPRSNTQERPIITTYQRSTYERSQLAIRSSYTPETSNIGDTFIGADGRMIRPKEQTVDFLYGFPLSPTDSPYPEKAVAAFYLGIGTDPEKEGRDPASYLADGLQQRYNQDGWGLGLTPDLISRVLVTSISYTPDREAELAHREREVTVVVSPVNLQNQALPPRRITWRLVGIPIPGEQDCEWRLAEIKSTIVTDGLGSLPLPSLAETAALVH